jgi:Flp pilus assembly protein TadD
MDAARALAGEAAAALQGEDRAAFENAIAEYVAGQLFNAERPESHANLGSLYLEQGQLDEARASFRKATEIDGTFVAAAISLADLERTAGNEAAAESILLQALAANPDSGPVRHALGLSLIRQNRTAEAMTQLAKAAKNAPEDPRLGYVFAVALHDTGKATEAIDVLKNTLARHPYDRDVLLALVSYEIEARDFASALERAELLKELEPNRPDITQLLAQLKHRVP